MVGTPTAPRRAPFCWPAAVVCLAVTALGCRGEIGGPAPTPARELQLQPVSLGGQAQSTHFSLNFQVGPATRGGAVSASGARISGGAP